MCPRIKQQWKFLCLKYCELLVFLAENFNQAVGYCYRNEVAGLLVAISNSYKRYKRNTFQNVTPYKHFSRGSNRSAAVVNSQYDTTCDRS